jgi:hypothetical protein
MTMALVRDTLLAAGLQQLRDTCSRPGWTVPIADLKKRFSVSDSAVAFDGSGLRLLTCQSGQSNITGHFQRRSTRARLAALLPPTLTAWPPSPCQCDHWPGQPPPENTACNNRVGYPPTQRSSHHHPSRTCHCVTRPGAVWNAACAAQWRAARSARMINLLPASPPRVLYGATTSRWTMARALEQAPASLPTLNHRGRVVDRSQRSGTSSTFPTLCVSVPWRPEPGCRAGLARCRGPASLGPLWDRWSACPLAQSGYPYTDRVDSPSGSNRSWVYNGEFFCAPTASKICNRHSPTITWKETDHGLTPKLNIYIYKNMIYIYIY